MKDKSMEQVIEEKFQTLLNKAEVDPLVKEDVFSTISKLDTLADVLDLFTSKFIQSEADFLDELTDPSE